MNPHKIAVIGGTGKSGIYLVNRLLEKGFKIRLLIRNADTCPFTNKQVEIVHGDARLYDSVQKLTEGCQALISTLGQPKNEPSIFSQATRNVISALKVHGFNRYIVTTGLNVDTPFDKKDEKVSFATNWMYNNFPDTTRDKQLEYNLLVESELDWTLVRLPLIVLTNESFTVQTNLENCFGQKISARDLAEFLITQLTDTKYNKKSPFLYNT